MYELSNKKRYQKQLTAIMLALSLTASCLFVPSGSFLTAYAGEPTETPVSSQEEEPLAVTEQPKSVRVKVWTKASFSVTATGTGELHYQWYYHKEDSGGWILWEGHDTAATSGTANPTWNLMRVRCVITDQTGRSVTSEEALVTVEQPLAITANQKNATFKIGDKATFSVSAKGTGRLRYQWYYQKTDSDGWYVWNGQKAAVIYATANATWDGMQIRCVVTDESGASVTSETAVITLAHPPVILTQPKNLTLKVGDTGTFSVSAEGTGALRYQWYYKKTDSDRFYIWNGQKTAVISATANATWNGMQVRCVISDQYGNSVTSETALIKIEQKLAVTAHPQNVTAAVGKTAEFSVKAQGTGTLQYRWYRRLSGEKTWSLWEGKTSAKLSFKAEKKQNGMEVYCLVSDAAGSSLSSKTAKLTVIPALRITSQPAQVTLHSGDSASFTVKAEGSGLRYQWYFKKAGKHDWVLWKGRTEATAHGKADCTWHVQQVRCLVTDQTGESVYSNAAFSFITKKSDKRFIKRTVTVKSNNTKLYSDAGTNNKLLGNVKAKTKFTVLEWKNDAKDLTWFRVRWNGKNAWLPRTKVTISDTFSAIPDRSFQKGGVPIIYLSPSRQIHNAYKYGSTTEGDQMYRVGNELKKILEEEYLCVVYMPPVEMKITIESRPTDAYNKETDVYLAIHSNANPSGKSYGATGYYFPNCAQSKKFAGNMTDEMDKVSPFTPTSNTRTVNGMKLLDNLGYGEVRDPAYFGMVSLLAEVEYHDNADSAKWIINNPKKIARALANALEKTIDMQKK